MTAWYYSDNQRNRHGPVAANDLAALHEGGQLDPGTLVWREGLPGWTPWREVMAEVLAGRPPSPAAASAPVPALATAAAATGSAAPADGRARFAIGDEPALAAAGGYNPYEIVAREPESPYAAPQAALLTPVVQVFDAGDVVFAGFWKRFAAYVIDAFILGIVGMVVQGVIGASVFGGMAAMHGDPSLMFTGPVMGGLALMYVAPLLIGATYYGFMQASANQATLGKMAVGIKVVDDAGGPISFWRGFARYFGLLLSCIPLCIGVIMAAFTDRKRALHDMLCSTLVVDRWAYTAHPERQRPELGVVTTVILCIAGLLALGYVAIFGTIMALVARAAGAH